MDDDKYLTLLAKMSEVGERTARMETSLDNVDKRLTFIENEDRTQNQLLSEHIEGTILNRQQIAEEKERRAALSEAHEKLKKRVEILERPIKAIRWLGENLLWIAIVGGGIVAILSYLKHG